MSGLFLNLISSKEAIAKGINLDDKNKHQIYNAIKEESTVKKAKSGRLFKLGDDSKIFENIPMNCCCFAG